MATIERRVTELEKARTDCLAPLLLFLDGERTAEQSRAIDEAERTGRLVFLLKFEGPMT